MMATGVYLLILAAVVSSMRADPVNDDVAFLEKLQTGAVMAPEIPSVLGRAKRVAGTTYRKWRWRSATVPYEFHKGHSFTEANKREIRKAMRAISQHTCVVFRAAKGDEDRISFVISKLRCQANLGRRGGRQKVYLSPRCRNKKSVIHELMHVLGFFHEQTRPDRDSYIVIKDKNILPKKLHNFVKLPDSYVNTFRSPFDYRSIMMYGAKVFSKNKLVTIKAKDPRNSRLLTLPRCLTFWDIQGINMMYCRAKKRCGKFRCENKGFLDKNCKCKCPNPASVCTQPTIDCPYLMKFRPLKKQKLYCPRKGGYAGLICAHPHCTEYRITRGTLGLLPFERTTFNSSVSSTTYYGGQQHVDDQVLSFIIKPLKCVDAATYTCKCYPRTGGAAVRKTWKIKVSGCDGKPKQFKRLC